MPGLMPFGLKIAIINREFRRRMDEKAAAMGLTSVQLRVLGSVSRLEAAGKEEIHQNDLERIEHVTHPAMTKMLQRLESKGFIRCVPSQKDHRYKKVTCTQRSAGIHRLILAQDLEAPVEPGQTVGELEVSVDGQVRDTVPILAAQGAARLTVPRIFTRLLRQLLMAG